ncbi:MAG: hypothetical protein IJW63_10570 [Lachnospiraceae bacterium]|nr:hypothetical protein [Lachnospiraceae bacterium]
MKTNSKKSKKQWLVGLIVALLILIGGCTWYLCDYYPADDAAISQFAKEHIYVERDWLPDIEISKQEIADGCIAYVPTEISAGFIFYPGGKVEHSAYEPLMMACARRGILSVVVEVPFRLAVFDINAADGIQAFYPEVKKWYIGGHSLGGSMAASYLANHVDAYDGLVLLASYSTADLTQSNLEILSLYGDQDGVLNLEKYQEYLPNINTDSKALTETIIEGGNHAFFGMYGKQSGDGESTIGNADQINTTADEIAKFIFE